MSDPALSTLASGNAESSPLRAKDDITANYDILKCVFSSLILPLPHDNVSTHNALSVNGRRDLYSLALSCKAFKDPALDCLWHNLPSMIPLLNLHPALQIVNGTHWFQQQELDDGKMHTFRRYSRRVRAVCVEEKGNLGLPPISLSSYVWLGRQLELGFALLPSLSRVQICDLAGDSRQFAILSLILSPSIQTVELRGSFQFQNGVFFSLVTPLLCQGSPSLRELALHEGSASQADAYGPLWTVISQCMGRLPIQILDLQFPHSAALSLDFLAGLPAKFRHLTSITLDVHTASHQPSEEVANLTNALPALDTVHLINRSEATLCPCFPSFFVQHATSVTFVLSGSANGDANMFAEAIEVLSGARGLKRVEMRSDGPYYIHPAALKSLLLSLELEDLHVRTWGLSMLDLARGQEIEVILDPLAYNKRPGRRQLTSLILPAHRPLPPAERRHVGGHTPYRYDQPPAIYPALRSLLHIARHAKNLQYLSMSIDSGVEQTLREMKVEWISQKSTASSLRRLQLTDKRRPTEKPFTPTQYRELLSFSTPFSPT